MERPSAALAGDSRSGEVSRDPASSQRPSAGGVDWDQRITSAHKGDFQTLLTQALEIADAAERTRVLAALLTRWIESDLPGLLAFIDASEVDETSGEGIWKTLGPALAQALTRLGDDAASAPALKGLMRRLIAHLAEADPAEALAWVGQWLPAEALESALARIVPELAKTSPQEARQLLETIHSPASRVEALNGLGTVLGRANAEQAIEWASALANIAERPYAMGSVLAALAEHQPERAAREFEQFRSRISTEYAAQVAIDRAVLATNASDQVEGDLGYFEARPSTVNPQLHLLNDAGVVIAEQWAATDPGAAMRWIETLPAGRMKQDALESALASWASAHGSEAFAYYAPNAASNAAAAESIFTAWATTDPGAASRQAGLIENPKVRANALSGVVGGWLGSGANQTTVEQWIDSLPPDSTRDLANAKIVEMVSLEHPDHAWQRAQTIGSIAPRKEAMESAFASLVESDPAGARAALLSANLSIHDAASLQRMLDAVTAKSTN